MKTQKKSKKKNVEMSTNSFWRRLCRLTERVGFFFQRFWLRIGTSLSEIKAHYLVIASAAFNCILIAVIAIIMIVPSNKNGSSNAISIGSLQKPIALTGNEDSFSGQGASHHQIIMDKLLNNNGSSVSVSMDDLSDLEYGVEDERVETLQIALIELGFLDIDETTSYYGPATRHAVMLFQRQHDLDQSGNADEATLKKLFSASACPYSISAGDEGEDVSEIHKQLMDLAYMDKATGYYGEQTVNAVKDFQERNSLSVTGIMDRKTRELLYMPDAVEGLNYAVKTRRRAKILTFVEVAEKQLGKRYSLGSTGPNYFDCSGLVYYCLREAGSNRRRLSADGYSHVNEWEKITSMSDLEIGDLLFYHIDSRSRIGHVGIYVGGGNMIDASFSEGRIVKRSCRTSYWTSRFAFARRPW